MGTDWRSGVNSPLKGRNTVRTCCKLEGVRLGVLRWVGGWSSVATVQEMLRLV